MHICAAHDTQKLVLPFAHAHSLHCGADWDPNPPSEKRATRAVRRREKAMRSSDERRDSMADEDAWMAARRRSLTRLRRKRQCRRVAGVEAATAFNYIGRLPPPSSPSPSPYSQRQQEVKFTAVVEEEDFEDNETDLAC